MQTPTISNIKYGLTGNGAFNIAPLGHEDYACFAIWEGGRDKEKQILADLKQNFEIIGNFLIYWSEEHYTRNIARLYESDSTKVAFSTNNKIGKPPFRFILVRDKNPQYTWLKSVSGAVEPSNEKIVRKKYEYRDWFARKFQVHSSNNLGEFILQAVLILGCDMFGRCMAGEMGDKETILRKDLEGAAGWKSWASLFRVLNYCSDYLVLRNFESLPERLDDSDIDFLCDNVQRLATAANIYQETGKPYKGVMTITGQTIKTDIRFVSDGYYPALWQKDMLAQKVLSNGFYVPRADDYFFSLLYHCKIHKKQVKPKYKTLLAAMAKNMRFDWFNNANIESEETAKEILSGYMKANFYFYEQPIDSGVGENEKIISALPRIENFGKKDKYRKVKKLAKRVKTITKEPRKSVVRKWKKLSQKRKSL
jgi:hypothetical protein